jgi:hypothetical protein
MGGARRSWYGTALNPSRAGLYTPCRVVLFFSDNSVEGIGRNRFDTGMRLPLRGCGLALTI